MDTISTTDLERKAEDVAGMLAAMANPRRLIILCRLAQAGEMTVARLTEAVGLSQSALSQHLALMRAGGLLATRKEGLNVHYRVADPRALRLMQSLERVFCPPEGET
ncbi:metalloregulator ArsR/SmtB family transcription factor [Roseiarcaceae bacterium H3SJ34-1]|uniref:ArsR/SmtB family transcription factor n=1 Tax=Terripilifer ovatus TaxID=3032367 RepID=UPI003AB95D4B|nr:metalloregulator ArsR/SmtB family transcription factor [Roseiarcaceae bacterium H3SJ34-1]